MKYQPPIGGDSNDPYVDGDPATGTPGSPVPAAAIEHPQREIVNVITAAGLTPDEDTFNQLQQAIALQISDANLLDGLNASSFLRADTNDTYTGLLYGARNDDEQLRLGQGVNWNPYISFYNQSTRVAYVQGRNDRLRLVADTTSNKVLDLRMDGVLQWTGHTVWHKGNDGSGSGLDADLLDGQDGKIYAPPGAVIGFAANTAPDGWIECHGGQLPRTTYSELFAVIRTTFGAGDGSTTFNLPDFRGEFLRGWDNGRGIDSGRTFGSGQQDEFKTHRHHSVDNARNDVAVRWGHDQGDFGSHYVSSNDFGYIYDAVTSYSGGSETRPRNKAIMYCIKY